MAFVFFKLQDIKMPNSGRNTRKGSGKKGRTRRDGETTQAAILKAATEEFTRWGFGGARIARITKRAKANDRSLYYYFESKKDLFRVALERTYLALAEAEVGLNLQSIAPRDAIKRLVEFTWVYHAEHPEFISLLNTENLHRGEHIRRSSVATTSSAAQMSIIKDILDRGSASGEFRTGVDPIHVFLTISGLSFFYLSNRYTLSNYLGIDTMDIDRKSRWVDHIADLVLAHLSVR